MRKTPFLRVCLMLIVGIYLNSIFGGYLIEKLIFTLISFFLLVLTYFTSLNKTRFINLFGFTLLLFVSMLGITADELHSIAYDESHFSNIFNGEGRLQYEGTILEKKEAYYNSYFVEVKMISLVGEQNAWMSSGYLKLSSKISRFNVGDEITFNGIHEKLPLQTNLYTFDYGKFLRRKAYHHQVFSEDIIKISSSESKLLILRERFSKAIANLRVTNESKAILNAMLLGDKSELGDLERIFRRTGTSHVLAISGLHVGIITALLYFIFGLFSNRYAWVKSVLTIIGVWSFCLISGAAPSTMRASIMVSCFLVGTIFQWKSYGLNFCFMAAFFMLILDPNKIYAIGFQFSFLAIVGILFFYEPIYKALVFQGIYDRLWQMTVLSVSAQLALTPLSLFYFHEFPVLFIVASTIAIPATFIIVCGGLCSLVVRHFFSQVKILESLLDWFINAIVSVLNILSEISGVVIENLWPSEIEVILYYFIIFSISAYFMSNFKTARIYLVASFIALLALQFSHNGQLVQANLILYAHPKEIHIDFIQSGTAISFDIAKSRLERTEWYRKPTHQYYHVHNKKSTLINRDHNQEIIAGNSRIFIMNRQQDIVSEYNFILINCKLSSSYYLQECGTYIDFKNNEEFRKNKDNILFNKQVIINF